VATVADRGRPVRPLGLRLDLAGHRVVRAAQAGQLQPVAPRIGERRVERERPGEQPDDLLVDSSLGVRRGRPPADLGPHQAERPVQQVPGVDRVGPPGRDVDREPRVVDGRLEPRVVARAKARGHRRVDRVLDAGRRPEVDGPGAAPSGVARGDQAAAEPREIAVLRDRALGGPGRIEDQAGGRRRGVLSLIGRPDDPVLGPDPLGEPPDERLVARPDGRKRRPHTDLAALGDGDDDVRRRRVEPDGQLADAALGGPRLGRADGVRILRADPGLDLG
jgi:hypothetical protein